MRIRDRWDSAKDRDAACGGRHTRRSRRIAARRQTPRCPPPVPSQPSAAGSDGASRRRAATGRLGVARRRRRASSCDACRARRASSTALGMWVAGMAVVSGFAMTVAASQWWSTSIVSVLWVLPLWAVLYCLIERLVLKSFGTSWVWNLVLTIPRLLLSLAIALVVGLPMAQVIYSGSINDAAEQDDDGADPGGDERDHAAPTTRRSRRRRRRSRRRERKEARLQQQVTNSTLPRRLRGRRDELLADPQARLRAVLQARRPPGGRRRGGAEARPARDRGDDRRRPAQDRDLAGGREPRSSRTGSPRSRPTATSSPARRRSSGSRRRTRP